MSPIVLEPLSPMNLYNQLLGSPQRLINFPECLALVVLVSERWIAAGKHCLDKTQNPF